VWKWFTNHIDGPRQQYTKFTQKWAARSVFYQLNCDRIMDHAMVMSMLKPRHPCFLGAPQRATTTLWAVEGDVVKEDYINAANKWSTAALLKKIQSRYCHTHSFLNLCLTTFCIIEWPQLCASGLSKTFKVNYIRHVVSTV
jgi:hypothetical protein